MPTIKLLSAWTTLSSILHVFRYRTYVLWCAPMKIDHNTLCALCVHVDIHTYAHTDTLLCMYAHISIHAYTCIAHLGTWMLWGHLSPLFFQWEGTDVHMTTHAYTPQRHICFKSRQTYAHAFALRNKTTNADTRTHLRAYIPQSHLFQIHMYTYA